MTYARFSACRLTPGAVAGRSASAWAHSSIRSSLAPVSAKVPASARFTRMTSGAGFGAHLAQACGRKRRIQRQVRTARLQDRQQTANRFDAPLKADSDQGLRADAQVRQLVGQLIGRLVQLTIGQLGSAGGYRGPVRVPPCLLTE